jgi:hypothetical protein
MLSYFCSKCGGKNLYQFQKPKFCSHCGANFSLASTISSSNIKSNQFEVSINTNKKTSQNINPVEDNSDNFEPFIQDYSSMRGLDVHIEKHNQDNGIRLGELVSDKPEQTPITASKKIIKQRRGRKKVAKPLPESFVSEAKMSGRNSNNYVEPNIIDNEE